MPAFARQKICPLPFYHPPPADIARGFILFFLPALALRVARYASRYAAPLPFARRVYADAAVRYEHTCAAISSVMLLFVLFAERPPNPRARSLRKFYIARPAISAGCLMIRRRLSPQRSTARFHENRGRFAAAALMLSATAPPTRCRYAAAARLLMPPRNAKSKTP